MNLYFPLEWRAIPRIKKNNNKTENLQVIQHFIATRELFRVVLL